MKNWKTTLIGLITGGSISIDAIVHQGLTLGWKQALLGLAIAVLGAVAKDNNVTGGTVSQ
jgi:hypothetical protein